ncbi:6-bladed beta-propeller [Sulfurimonas sp. CS5]|uniref:6-bladed beta-propeller n=1 Tax=Sulfurimonas sp. CS5 TaxID=3391145 RepID=UPI0039EA0AB6
MNVIIFLGVFLLSTSCVNAKETQKLVWPSPPDEARIEYVASAKNFKDLGMEKGFFSKIYDFVVGDEDPIISSPFGMHTNEKRVYVTDTSSRALHIFDKEENEQITVRGTDNETFLYPIDVVSDSKGNIFVSDSVRAKVYVFEKDGDYSYTIKLPIFQRPVGIAISPDNKNLYIVDTLACKIHITTLKGEFVKSIGKKGSLDGEFNRPTFIDVADDGKLYVTDSMNHRVQILDNDGNFIHKFGELGQNIGNFGSPRGIALDSYNNIYVSDVMFNNIQIFNKNGELLMVLGSYGEGFGEFALPEDISITKDNTIYVSDTNNKRLQVFKLLEIDKKGSSQ